MSRRLKLHFARRKPCGVSVEIKLPRPLDRPDGMRAIGKQRLLLAENSGKMSIKMFAVRLPKR